MSDWNGRLRSSSMAGKDGKDGGDDGDFTLAVSCRPSSKTAENLQNLYSPIRRCSAPDEWDECCTTPSDRRSGRDNQGTGRPGYGTGAEGWWQWAAGAQMVHPDLRPPRAGSGSIKCINDNAMRRMLIPHFKYKYILLFYDILICYRLIMEHVKTACVFSKTLDLSHSCRTSVGLLPCFELKHMV